MNLFKSLFSVMCLWGITTFACAAIVPEQVLKDWQRCQSQEALDAQCMAIGDMAMRISELSDSMEINPQHFGIDIMDLQEKISKMPDSKQKFSLQQELDLRLAIVGWLRSPR